MGQHTAIEWTDRSWNPVRGCTRVSPGCQHCYAERQNARELPGHASPTTGEPFARMTKAGARWTGAVEFLPHKLAEPLSWRKPQRVFVNSMSDLFHEALSFEEIAAVFGVMAACPHLTFQVLTKRPALARAWFEWARSRDIAAITVTALADAGFDAGCGSAFDPEGWPPPNVWLGVSAEDQAAADERIPLLLQCPAAVRFVSYEPALGPVDFQGPHVAACHAMGHKDCGGCAVDWIIAGGESGPGARPPHPQWFRSVRDQSRAAGVAFFFKQWGEWAGAGGQPNRLPHAVVLHDGRSFPYDGEHPPGRGPFRGDRPEWPAPVLSAFDSTEDDDPDGPAFLARAGKRKAGRILDGRTWDEFPGEASA